MVLRRDVPTAWQSLAVNALAVQKKGAVKIGPFGSQLKKNELRNEGVRVYGQENVLQDDFGLGNRFVDDVKFDSLRSVQLFAGDVVLTMMGSVGAATVVPDGIPTGIMDSHLLRIQPNTSVIEPKFLAKVLRDSSEIKNQIRARSQGGIMSGLNARIVRSLEVPVPPLPEQRKIAAILSSVDDAIEKTQAVIDQVQVVKRGLKQELLTRGLPGRHTRFKQTEIGEIPEDWDFLSLVDLAEPGHGLQTGPFGSQLHASDYVAHGVPVIMPKDMMNGYVSDAYSARISDEMAEELRRHKVRAGDILVARRGDLGRAGLIRQHEEGWICGTGCFRFRPKNRTVSRFIRHWITWPVSVRWLNEHAVGQTMLNLNTSILGRLPVALPSEAERSTIASIMEALAEQMQTLGRRAEGLDTLKRSLMSVLLTGELRVTPDAETR